MRTYSGYVRLNGRLDQVVPKKGMTAAEIVLLRSIHAHDAVVDIKDTGEVHRTYSEEYERLCQVYGSKNCEATWPGAQKVLPATIDEIQVVGQEPTSYTVVGSNFKRQSKDVQAAQLARQGAAAQGLPYKAPAVAAVE